MLSHSFMVDLDLRSGIVILEASHAFLPTCSVFEPSLGTATKVILQQWSRVTRQVSCVLEQVTGPPVPRIILVVFVVRNQGDCSKRIELHPSNYNQVANASWLHWPPGCDWRDAAGCKKTAPS